MNRKLKAFFVNGAIFSAYLLVIRLGRNGSIGGLALFMYFYVAIAIHLVGMAIKMVIDYREGKRNILRLFNNLIAFVLVIVVFMILSTVFN